MFSTKNVSFGVHFGVQSLQNMHLFTQILQKCTTPWCTPRFECTRVLKTVSPTHPLEIQKYEPQKWLILICDLSLTKQLLQLPKKQPKLSENPIKLKGRVWSSNLINDMLDEAMKTRFKLHRIPDKSSKEYHNLYQNYENMKKELKMTESDDYNGVAKLTSDYGNIWSENIQRLKVEEYIQLLNTKDREVS